MILTIECDEASRLSSESFERHLAWYERWALRMHVLGCRSCRYFRRHLQFLHQAFQRLAEDDILQEKPASLALSDAVKQRMKSEISRHSN